MSVLLLHRLTHKCVYAFCLCVCVSGCFYQDHAHQIDYNEFMCGLAICSHGSPADKTRMLFDVFNLNHEVRIFFL